MKMHTRGTLLIALPSAVHGCDSSVENWCVRVESGVESMQFEIMKYDFAATFYARLSNVCLLEHS